MMAAQVPGSSAWGLASSVKKRQARAGNLLDRLNRKRQYLVRDDLIGFLAEAFLQSSPPRNPEFRIDVNDVDSGADRLAQIFIVGSRSAVQGKRYLHRTLDLGDSLDVQSFPRLTLHHALQHSVHVADCGSKDVYPRRFDKLFRLRRRSQALRQVGRGIMNLRPGSDVADFALDQDRRIDGLEGFDGLLGLADVLLERKRREVENDRVKTCFGDIQSVRNGCGPR